MILFAVPPTISRCKCSSLRSLEKNVPKAARISPDSFIQIAFQVAYFRLHGAHPPTYETGTLRQFADGRTETIRLPNAESAQFVEAFAGKLRQTTNAELCELFSRRDDGAQKLFDRCDERQAAVFVLLKLKLSSRFFRQRHGSPFARPSIDRR